MHCSGTASSCCEVSLDILLGPVRRVDVPLLADDALACFADHASVVSPVFMVAVWERNSLTVAVLLKDDGRKSKE